MTTNFKSQQGLRIPRPVYVVGLVVVASLATGCTQLLPSQFLLQQQQQTFSGTSTLNVNTKIDMLWVIDNSSSMDANQEKLRAGFAAFAAKYMQPTWDIRVAAIPTDAYLANPLFSGYLARTINGSAGAADPYIVPLVTHNPQEYIVPTNSANWNVSETSVVDMSSGDYSGSGVLFNQLVPAWGPNYAKLGFDNGASLVAMHDGPVASLCGSFVPYFLDTAPDCAIRDSRAKSGTADCINPAVGENGVSQCVNTVQNDTVHTGLPFISTLGGSVTTLTNEFMVNLTTGTTGHGSSRELGSMLQFLNDNEAAASPTQFFRKGSLRVIVFVTDADDQTLSYQVSDSSNPSFSPWTHYQCDLATLDSLNAGDMARLPANFCCTGGTCTYGTEGTSCPSKTIQNNNGTNYTYTVTSCANPADLLPVSSAKTQLDNFFENLDGAGSSNPNYFVATITDLTGDSVRATQAVHDADDTSVGAPVQFLADRADRLITLGDEVGNGSMAMDITAADYSPILNAIGQEIITQKGTFQLTYPATSQEQMSVTIQHIDGTSTTLQNSQYTISGTTLQITDLNVVLTLQSTDKIVINYQPANSFI